MKGQNVGLVFCLALAAVITVLGSGLIAAEWWWRP